MVQSMEIPVEHDLKSYEFELPEAQIAQHPCERRDASRLYVLDRMNGDGTAAFADLPDLLPPGALLVANNSKVLPARLYGTKPTGGRVEFLLLTPLPCIGPGEPVPGDADERSAEVEGLLRASKGPRPGERVDFDAGLSLTVLERGEFGKSRVRLNWSGELAEALARVGHLPLPPYITRPDDAADRGRYQTVYAREDKLGSMAAPTAGLHFTPELRERLAGRGFGWAEVTLYVGYGTFSPIRERDIRRHVMHREFIEVPEATAEAIRRAKAEGRPVVAVGTTSVRALEGAVREAGDLGGFAGWTDIFITPGYKFRVVDHMLTNFHLPGSSLVVMVSAFAGRERVLAAYARAIAEGFRFFSYGDAMLIR